MLQAIATLKLSVLHEEKVVWLFAAQERCEEQLTQITARPCSTRTSEGRFAGNHGHGHGYGIFVLAAGIVIAPGSCIANGWRMQCLSACDRAGWLSQLSVIKGKT
jgi:hypothetical protein